MGKKKALIEIEESFFSDPRLQVLTRLCKGDVVQAYGSLINLWHIGFMYWKRDCTLIPAKQFKNIPYGDLLVESEFVEKRPEGFYVKGSKKFWMWYVNLINGASKAGRKSAELRRIARKVETQLVANDSEQLGLNASATPFKTSSSSSSSSGSSASTSTSSKTKTLLSTCVDHPLQKIWNENCGKLPKSQKLNPQRKKLADARWKETPDEAYWINVTSRIAKSAFCNGNSDSAWVATFDWFLKPDTHIRAMEGKYDDRDKKGYYLTPELKRSHNNNVRMQNLTGKTIEEFMNGDAERDAKPVKPNV